MPSNKKKNQFKLNMNNQKIAIVGAGICGLYLAWKLAKAGNSVTVFEKKNTIGKEVCSGLFSERILEFIPESKKLIQNQIDYCLIHFPKKTIKIKFSKKFFVINHFELDKLVASLAENAGAKIVLNYNITDSELDKIKNEFDKVVGCDGALSQVRKSLKLKDPQFFLGIQGFVDAEPIEASNYVETWPTLSGFLWKIPRGREIEYGIMEKPEKAKKLFEEFLKENNLNLNRMNSVIIPQSLIIPSNLKITLCGDAAGLTKPWSGGGVVWSLFASEVLLKNFPDFLKYQKELKRRFLPKIIFSKMVKKIVYLLGFKTPWLLPGNYTIESDFLI